MTNPAPVLVSAGEPSGDRAAARVASVLRASGVSALFGVGGQHLQAAGVSLVARIDEISALGLADAARRFAHWAGVWTKVRSQIRARRPAAALLVDAPEFHLPLARVLKAEGIPVILYIGPQVWAWRKRRLALLRDRVDLTALILPFEKELYDREGVPAVFVGHPLLDEPPPAHPHLVRHALGISPDAPLVALLPGSRPKEIERHLPVMADTVRMLADVGISARIAPGGAGVAADLKERDCLLPPPFSARDLLAASDAGLVASGTATLEAAVLGVPLAAVYKTDPVTYAAARYAFHIPYIALPNWVAERRIVPELVQDRVTPETLSRTARALLRPRTAARLRKTLEAVSRRLGTPGAATRTAALVLERLS